MTVQPKSIQQQFKIVNPAGQSEVILIFTRFIRQSAAHMVGNDDPVVRGKPLDQISKIKGPGGISVDHDNGVASAFIQIVITQPAYFQKMG